MLSDTATSSSALPGWFLPAIDSVERVFTSCHTPLANRMAWTRMRLARMNGATSIAGAVTASVATPGIALLEALRHDYSIAADDPRVVAVGEGMLLLYCFLRVQDDIVDEPEALDRGYVYVAQLFSGASLRPLPARLVEVRSSFASTIRPWLPSPIPQSGRSTLCARAEPARMT